ncbi:hypothetical protein T11_16098, partial [Trichinella zimbabwensis]
LPSGAEAASSGHLSENREGQHGGLQATWPWGDSGAGLGDHGTRGQESWGGRSPPQPKTF